MRTLFLKHFYNTISVSLKREHALQKYTTGNPTEGKKTQNEAQMECNLKAHKGA